MHATFEIKYTSSLFESKQLDANLQNRKCSVSLKPTPLEKKEEVHYVKFSADATPAVSPYATLCQIQANTYVLAATTDNHSMIDKSLQTT